MKLLISLREKKMNNFDIKELKENREENWIFIYNNKKKKWNMIKEKRKEIKSKFIKIDL